MPDFILLTGDLARHDDYKPIPRTFDEIMHENNLVAKYIATAFPNIPVLPSIGNNDVYPHDQMFPPGPNNTVLPGLAKAWAPLLDADMTQAMLQGGWMSRILTNGNRALSLNTLYFAYGPDCNVTGATALEQLEWLSALLENAQQSNSYLIISGHVPPHMWLPSCRALYAQLCSANAGTIKAQIFGHLHSDQFHFIDSDGTVDPAHPDPASSIAVTCAPSIVPTFNPSYRVWDYDPETLDLQDYTQYYANLDKLYEKFRFEKEYSLRDAYSMSSTNVSSIEFWIELNKRIGDSASLAIQYELFKYVSIISPPGADDSRCKRGFC